MNDIEAQAIRITCRRGIDRCGFDKAARACVSPECPSLTMAPMPPVDTDIRGALLDANDMCRSLFQVCNRIATDYGTDALNTRFGALSERLNESLKRQHAVILATGGYPQAGPDR